MSIRVLSASATSKCLKKQPTRNGQKWANVLIAVGIEAKATVIQDKAKKQSL